MVIMLLVASFFDFMPPLSFLQNSYILRVVQQFSMFYHHSPHPPDLVYVTDGGMMDNTGILMLLRRRCRHILSVYAGEEEEPFVCLKKVMRIMHQEDIGSLYDIENPRRSPLTVLRRCSEERWTHLELGIYYNNDEVGTNRHNMLIVVRNHVPQSFQNYLPVRKLLTEAEIIGEAEEADVDEQFEGMLQTDLGGCCCDCCHRHFCNGCMGFFPTPPTSNQFLTPQMVNSLCRLGRATLTREALEKLRSATVQSGMETFTK